MDIPHIACDVVGNIKGSSLSLSCTNDLLVIINLAYTLSGRLLDKEQGVNNSQASHGAIEEVETSWGEAVDHGTIAQQGQRTHNASTYVAYAYTLVEWWKRNLYE